MQRRTFRIALDLFLAGAMIPLMLLLVWRELMENATIAAQHTFLKVAFVLWPTGMQILVVPHAPLGDALTIAILILQNAILYSVVALLVLWILRRVRHGAQEKVAR